MASQGVHAFVTNSTDEQADLLQIVCKNDMTIITLLLNFKCIMVRLLWSLSLRITCQRAACRHQFILFLKMIRFCVFDTLFAGTIKIFGRTAVVCRTSLLPGLSITLSNKKGFVGFFFLILLFLPLGGTETRFSWQ